jgi:hypothetical protein
MKAIEELLRMAEQTTLVDKDNGQRLPAEFALITDDETRRLHHTFPDIGTPAGRLKHYKINVYMRNILIQIFGNVWPDIADAVDLLHIRTTTASSTSATFSTTSWSVFLSQ